MSVRADKQRRSYGSGSIWIEHQKRRDVWIGQVRAGRIQRQRTLGPVRSRGSSDGMTRAMAERALREFRSEVEQDAERQRQAPEVRSTLSVIVAQLIAQLEAGETRATTIADYRGYLRLHLLPFFGDVELSSIAVRHVEDFITHQQLSRESGGKGLQGSTVSNQVNFLHSIFAFAQRREVIDRNPVSVARKPKVARPRVGAFLTVEQVEAIIRAVPDDYLGQTDRTIVLTAAMTGLRQGELIALRWRDILWTEGRVRVAASVSRGIEGDTKSDRSRRRVPLPTRVAIALEQHHRATHYASDGDRVFCHPHTGRPYDPSKMRSRFYDAMRAAQLGHLIGRKGGGITFHSLRHTYATTAASAGVPLVAIQVDGPRRHPDDDDLRGVVQEHRGRTRVG